MKVFLTQAIDPEGIARLERGGWQITPREADTPIAHDALIAALPGHDALLSMPTDPVDAAVLATPGLKIVAQHAVGVDNIDLEAARARGIAVTHTPGVLTDATADLTMALLLAVVRHVTTGHALMQRDAFLGWRPLHLRGLALQDATLGIIGMGRIGQAVATRAQAFGMRVIHHSRRSGVPLSDLLATSDIVSLHCPLTEATRHLIDATALAQMKAGAYLLNTARGAVVDEDAVVEALQCGRLAGAGFDVHAQEPHAHPALRADDRVVLLPHLGSATVAARHAMACLAADNLVAFGRGEALPHPVADGRSRS